MKPRGIPFINLIHKSAISIQIHFVLSVSLFPLICLLKKISLCIIRDIFQFINYSELNENEQYHNLDCTHINLRSLQSIINRYFLCGISSLILPISSLSFRKKNARRVKRGWEWFDKKRDDNITWALRTLSLHPLDRYTLSFQVLLLSADGVIISILKRYCTTFITDISNLF